MPYSNRVIKSMAWPRSYPFACAKVKCRGKYSENSEEREKRGLWLKP